MNLYFIKKKIFLVKHLVETYVFLNIYTHKNYTNTRLTSVIVSKKYFVL